MRRITARIVLIAMPLAGCAAPKSSPPPPGSVWSNEWSPATKAEIATRDREYQQFQIEEGKREERTKAAVDPALDLIRETKVGDSFSGFLTKAKTRGALPAFYVAHRTDVGDMRSITYEIAEVNATVLMVIQGDTIVAIDKGPIRSRESKPLE